MMSICRLLDDRSFLLAATPFVIKNKGRKKKKETKDLEILSEYDNGEERKKKIVERRLKWKKKPHSLQVVQKEREREIERE